jgi:hypothetical protein
LVKAPGHHAVAGGTASSPWVGVFRFVALGLLGLVCSGIGARSAVAHVGPPTVQATLAGKSRAPSGAHVINGPSLSFGYRGVVRDRVGKGNTAISADGSLDGIFGVNVTAGSGSVVQMELRRTDGNGTWDTVSSTGWWALGAAATLDGGPLYNNGTASLTFPVIAGDTFYLFASDLYPSLFPSGVQFQLRVWFGDGSIATLTTTINSPPPPTLSLSFRGKVRDRVGKSNVAVAADGETDGVFAATLPSGSGSRTVLQTELRRTSGGDGVWDTTSTTNWWTLGAAGSLDGALNNNTATATVNLPVGDGGTFYVFGADLSPSLFVVGAQFKLTVWFADGSIATATKTLSAAPPPTLSLSYRGKARDRVGKGNTAIAPDGNSDAAFAVNVQPGSGSRTILQMELRRTSGGDGVWDTASSTNWWALGAAGTLDGQLYNNSAAAVNFDVGDGDTFYIFGGDLDPSLFVGGTTFQLTVWFADLSTATASVVMTPVSTSPPSIFGLANEGETLNADPGIWAPTPDALATQWQRCDQSGASCADLPGYTGTTYALAHSDFASTFRLRVTATNSSGSTTVVSRPSISVLGPLSDLALTYRPTLLFHLGYPAPTWDAEKWRPLEISNFFAEPSSTVAGQQGIEFCTSACSPLTNPQGQFSSGDADEAYLDIADAWDPGCYHHVSTGATVFDCDSGPHTAMYFWPGQDNAAYRYLDFWFFYRENRPQDIDFGELDDHDGDWEGMTIVLDGFNPRAVTLAYAWYAAHGKGQWYDLNALSAAGSVDGSTHAKDYVAAGTHASYPTQCLDTCSTPAGVAWPEEAPHDGYAPWGANDDASCAQTCVKRFTENWWTFWAGRWGASRGSLSDDLHWSPHSPGRQSRFLCTDHGYDLSCARPPGARGPAARSPATRPGDPRTCRAWFGGGTSVVACDPKLLVRAIRTHRMRQRGRLHLAVNGRRGGDSPGLAQVIGEPLVAGDRITITGQGTRRTIFFVAIRVGTHLYRSTFLYSELPRASRIDLRIALTGRQPVIRIGSKALRTKMVRLR